MSVGPAPVLALLVGILHVSIYVLVRGRAGQRVPVLVVAAFLGAWAGDALAGRLGADPLRIGDFHLIGASILAWVGIASVAIVAVLAEREAHRRTPDAHPMSTALRRRPPVASSSSSSPGSLPSADSSHDGPSDASSSARP